MSLYKNECKTSLVFDKPANSKRRLSVGGKDLMSPRGTRRDIIDLDEECKKLPGVARFLAEKTLVPCTEEEAKVYTESLVSAVVKTDVKKKVLTPPPPDLSVGISGGRPSVEEAKPVAEAEPKEAVKTPEPPISKPSEPDKSTGTGRRARR